MRRQAPSRGTRAASSGRAVPGGRGGGDAELADGGALPRGDAGEQEEPVARGVALGERPQPGRPRLEEERRVGQPQVPGLAPRRARSRRVLPGHLREPAGVVEARPGLRLTVPRVIARIEPLVQ